MGQTLRASVNYSSYSKSVELGFTEPYRVRPQHRGRLRHLPARLFSSFNFVNNNRNTTYKQVTHRRPAARRRAAHRIYVSSALRYGLNHDDVTLDEATFFTDPDGDGPLPAVCDPLRVGRYLCDAIGKRTTSSIGYSLLYDTPDNRLRPTRGQRFTLSQDFAGLGGDVKYLRTRANAAKYWRPRRRLHLLDLGRGRLYPQLREQPGAGQDPVRLIDRFFLGEPQIRGFDIRGVGPRVQRIPYRRRRRQRPGHRPQADLDDALGGRAYYVGRAELEIPLGSGIRELGLRPSIFVDVGALFGLTDPVTQPDPPGQSAHPEPLHRRQRQRRRRAPTTRLPDRHARSSPGITPFDENYLGDTAKPRLSVGFGVNWNSPFGPFRIDIAKALLKADGDDTKLITFNVGTAF